MFQRGAALARTHAGCGLALPRRNKHKSPPQKKKERKGEYAVYGWQSLDAQIARVSHAKGTDARLDFYSVLRC